MSDHAGLIFGIDGGGSGCRAIVCSAGGRRLGNGSAGPANIMTNSQAASVNIVEACRQALDDAGRGQEQLSDATALLGVAGANIGSYGSQIVKALPFRRCVVETDGVIALQGALRDSDGVVAIIGTGSVFISRSSGSIRSIGGWGFMVGDLGSGARLGRELLQEALLVYDGVHRGSPLTSRILEHFRNNPQTIVEYAHAAKPGEFGLFAPMILEFADKGDPVAQAILQRAVGEVEEMLDAIMVGENQSLCMLGGLGERYGALIGSRYRARIVAPLGNAVDGAVDLALKTFVKPGDRP